MLQRGEKINDLVDRSNELSMQSKMFYKTAKKVCHPPQPPATCPSIISLSSKIPAALSRRVDSPFLVPGRSPYDTIRNLLYTTLDNPHLMAYTDTWSLLPQVATFASLCISTSHSQTVYDNDIPQPTFCDLDQAVCTQDTYLGSTTVFRVFYCCISLGFRSSRLVVQVKNTAWLHRACSSK